MQTFTAIMDLIKHRVWGIKNLFSEFVNSKI